MVVLGSTLSGHFLFLLSSSVYWREAQLALGTPAGTQRGYRNAWQSHKKVLMHRYAACEQPRSRDVVLRMHVKTPSGFQALPPAKTSSSSNSVASVPRCYGHEEHLRLLKHPLVKMSKKCEWRIQKILISFM